MAAERLWLREPLTSFDAVLGPGVADGGVVIEHNRIVERLARGAEPAAPVQHVFDARGLILLPGLINTHHHFYQTLTRALPAALNKPLFPWLEALYPVWARMTEPMVAVAAELAMAELLLSGCTTAVDHHYVFSPQLPNAIDVQVDAAARLGLRVVLTRGSMSLGKSQGGLPPDDVTQSATAILDDSERLVRSYHDPRAGALCQLALAPCSPFSVTPELMQATAALAEEHDVLLHTHLAETEDENRFCEQHFGKRPLDYLEAVGWLGPRTWLAHGIHFTGEELRRLGTAGTGICHCPSSNMLLASGLCPVRALEAAGVAVGLGVDGSASNDCSNLIQEARQALLLQRLRSGAEVTHEDALRWATAGGARVLHRPELGRLEVGAAADLALFELAEPRFSGAGDPLAALVLSGAHRAAWVMVDGHWRVRGGELVDLDLQDLLHRHGRAAAALCTASV